MTTLAHLPVETASDGDGLHALAVLVTEAAATRLGFSFAEIERAMASSVWGTAREMIEREFGGTYRGYYPKCDMEVRSAAVIAEVFDAIAEMLGDPRRALRTGIYMSPALRNAGERADG